MIEQKIIEKIRKILIADSTLNTYTNKRVYGAFIASVLEPEYPAISIHVLDGGARPELDALIEVNVQIDLWFQSTDYDFADVATAYQRVRSLLHRQNLTDTTIDVKVMQTLETSVGPMIFEDQTDLLHFPSRYRMVAI